MHRSNPHYLRARRRFSCRLPASPPQLYGPWCRTQRHPRRLHHLQKTAVHRLRHHPECADSVPNDSGDAAHEPQHPYQGRLSTLLTTSRSSRACSRSAQWHHSSAQSLLPPGHNIAAMPHVRHRFGVYISRAIQPRAYPDSSRSEMMHPDRNRLRVRQNEIGQVLLPRSKAHSPERSVPRHLLRTSVHQVGNPPGEFPYL